MTNHSVDDVTYANQGTVSGSALSDISAKQRNLALRGAQLLAKALQAEGVDLIFGYPGGANLEIFDVLAEFGIRCIRTEHEQGAVHAAQGFARSTGKVGVCLATSGPGATNLVTGIADAMSDSVGIVCITGNVPSHLLGKNAFQEVDIVAVTEPITKKNYLVSKVFDIPEIVRESFAIAGGNRPGPVLIDIPKDIQQHYPRDSEGNYTPPRIPAVIEPPEPARARISPTQLEQALRMIKEAQRPVLYAGGGIASAKAEAELLELAQLCQIPVTTTLMGHGSFPPDHPLALHTLGMHGSKYANTAINKADLVIAVGVRFDDRVTGNVEEFIQDGRIIHIDIDRKELNKNKAVTLPICADVRLALQQLVAGSEACQQREWCQQVTKWKQDWPYPVPQSDLISPQFAIAMLSQITKGDAIVSLGVGQHQMWAMQHYQSTRPRSFLSSSGFGTMGYGLPAAIGAKAAFPERCVIDIDGDGSLNMTVHELATCHRFKLGVKVVVINNQWLGMVRQWQDMIYQKNRASSSLSDPFCSVKADGEEDIYPDFLIIAEGYRVSSARVTRKEDLHAAFTRMLADPDEPYLLDVIVAPEENVYPMIPAGGSYHDIIMSDEDLAGANSEQQGSNI
ncbi:biosynthetic-type acetolactate synthase large subunit [Parahaliea sp. F7430]|uniref:Acetolactate synthase n=1 Tax=Sediminihaliea albiluteola TaxID=2758564 RepID=A0A7W2YJ74_9GAMM|nr:biosynthetic-type acetolactate synthase large subunit [Sediminihaliea albiluteola]MBA6411993.1 biosynthetic-type acetolactate synthase large subunit [Sediminihaliea albiluteola]